MGISFFNKIMINNAKKFYHNPFSVENMALYVLVKKDYKEKGAKYVANHYFKKIIDVDQSKYKTPFDQIMSIEDVFIFCLNSLHFSMSKTLSWVGDVCELMLNGSANLFREIPFNRINWFIINKLISEFLK